MPDTDRLVAAIFSAAMNVKEPTAAGLIAQYEYFLKEIPARRQAEQRKAEAIDSEAWKKSTY